MAKAAPKGKDTAAKTTQNKAAKPSGKTAGKAAASAAKKAPAKGGNKKVSRGDQYSCEVCGLIVSVDESCGCVDACDIICCGEEMKARK